MTFFHKMPFSFINSLRGLISTNNKTPPENCPDSTFPDLKARASDRPFKCDKWYYPSELSKDLQDVDLAWQVKEEVFACAWEYTRCVIPQYTNWKRYIAFVRTIVVAIVAEYQGSLVDISTGDYILGYDMKQILDVLYEGTPGQ